MSADVTVRPAQPEEAGALSELAIRSKAHWGYSSDFLEACRDELRVDADSLEGDVETCYVATDGGSILGYCSFDAVSAVRYELDALFVEPRHIGRGIGRRLAEFAIAELTKRGASVLVIQGDPNAAGFYRALGARYAGERESGSIPGRFLPLFELDLNAS